MQLLKIFGTPRVTLDKAKKMFQKSKVFVVTACLFSCSTVEKQPVVTEGRGAECGSVPLCPGGLQAKRGALLSRQHPLPLSGNSAGRYTEM